MTWDQIREISKENFVEIGNHSHTHEYLVEEKSELIKNDIEKNQYQFLKKNLVEILIFFLTLLENIVLNLKK